MVLPCHRGITYHGDGLLSWYAVTPTRMPSAEMATSTLRHIAHKIRYHSIFRITAVRLLPLPLNNSFPNSFGRTPHRGVRARNSARSFTDQTLLLIHGPFAQTASALPSSVPATQSSEDDSLGGVFRLRRQRFIPRRKRRATHRILGLISLNDYAKSAGATTSWFGNACDCMAADKPLSGGAQRALHRGFHRGGRSARR